MREHLSQRLGGTPRQHNRLMLSLWSLMHGTAMLLIRGDVIDPLRTQMFHACLDAVELIVRENARGGKKNRSGPEWPSTLILGEAAQSKVDQSENSLSLKRTGKPKSRNKSRSV
jgi:hypothetical protein